MNLQADLAIDPSLADLYIMLDRVDVHCVLTSQAVLDLLPSPLPPSPPGGVVVTDPGPGVFCDNAMDGFIFPLAPNPSPSQKKRWFRSAMSSLNSVGIVGVGDAAIRPADVKILEQMAEEGEMSVRVNVMLECEDRNTYCPIEVKGLKILPPNRSVGGDMLMLGGVKIFADGALGSWGAALLEPYTDRPETSGTMLINETELTAVVGKVCIPVPSALSLSLGFVIQRKSTNNSGQSGSMPASKSTSTPSAIGQTEPPSMPSRTCWGEIVRDVMTRGDSESNTHR